MTRLPLQCLRVRSPGCARGTADAATGPRGRQGMPPGPGTLALVVLAWMLVIAPLQAREVIVLGVFPDRALLAWDGERQVLRVGDPALAGVRLLSTDTRLRSAWLEVDGERQAVGVTASGAPDRLAPGARASAGRSQPVPLRIRPDADGTFSTRGSIDGHAVSFQLDRSAEYIVLGTGEAHRLGIDTAAGRLTPVQTDSGRSLGYRVRLDRVRVGGIELRDVEAMVLLQDAPRIPLLGRSFLNRIAVREDGAALVLAPTF